MCPNDILIIVVFIPLMVWELLRKSRYFRVTPRIHLGRRVPTAHALCVFGPGTRKK